MSKFCEILALFENRLFFENFGFFNKKKVENLKNVVKNVVKVPETQKNELKRKKIVF